MQKADGQGQGWPPLEKKEMVSPGSRGSSSRTFLSSKAKVWAATINTFPQINSLPGWERVQLPWAASIERN